MRFSVIIPTRNAGRLWDECAGAIKNQSLQPERVLVIDSSSEDDTVIKAQGYGFQVRVIPTTEFGHGVTRQEGFEQFPDIDIHVFLTQDAILADKDALRNIITAFDRPEIGMAYGRQLPRLNAGLLEAHARCFNYPEKSVVRSLKDKNTLGMKTVFTSNSFAAYRTRALQDIGGFPSNTIVSEDMYVAAKMLLTGWKLAYCAGARVYHSHDYSMKQEFQRYFDIGVFNSRESWIRREFGGAESEGGRFVKSEIAFLLRNNPLLIPEALLRAFFKLLGYRFGLIETRIPLRIKRAFSMQKNYWL